MGHMRMRRLVSVLVSGLVFVGAWLMFDTTSAGQSDDTAKGAALLAEARKAVGGEEKLAAVKRLQVKGEMRRGQSQGQVQGLTLDGDTEVFFELPDKFRRNESLSLGPGGPGIDRVEILNGNEVWDENSGATGRGGFGRGGDFGGGGGRGGDFGGGGGGRGGDFRGGFGGRGGGLAGLLGGDADQLRAQGVDPERVKELQLRSRRTEMARLLIAILLTTDGPVAWIGTAQAPDGTADVLEIKNADGVATRLFLDTRTHMPLMMTWSGGTQRAARGEQGQRQGQQGGQARLGRGGDDAAPQAGAPRGGAPASGAGAPQGGAAVDTLQGRRGRGPALAAATVEMHLSNYKVVNDLKLPHLITRGTNGETAEEWTIKSYRINPTFKANTFTK